MAPVAPGHWRLRQEDGVIRAILPGLPKETMSQTKQTGSPNQTKKKARAETHTEQKEEEKSL